MATTRAPTPIIPVTTGILSSVSVEGNVASLTLDGRDVKELNIVGYVTKFTRDSATFSMTIVDNFGSFPCMKYTTGLDAHIIAKYDALTENTLVRLIGDLKVTKKDGCYLSIDNITICENLDTLHAHYLEIIKMRHAAGALSSVVGTASAVKPEPAEPECVSTANVTPANSAMDYVDAGEKSVPAAPMNDVDMAYTAPVPVAASMSSSMLTSAQAEQIADPKAKAIYTVVETLIGEAKDSSIPSIVTALAERAGMTLSAEEVESLLDGDELSSLIFRDGDQYQI